MKHSPVLVKIFRTHAFCFFLILFAKTDFGQARTFGSLPPTQISDSLFKRSFVYAVKDTNSLGLDIYTLKDADSTNRRPCIIFAFGGAFVTGRRDDSIYNRYFNTLVENNWIVVSISYRLGLRGVRHVSKFKIKPFRNAVNMAVDDMYDATNWVIHHAASFGIDTSRILLSGSSSGAITALTADFERNNDYAEAAKLPTGFQYAGLITFSGALLSFKGSLKYKQTPAPKLMFHGTADQIVPYEKIRFLNRAFYGSSWIAKISKEKNYPYYLYSEVGIGHEVSYLPMVYNLPVILDFLDKFILMEKQFEINVSVRDPDQKPIMTISSDELMKKLNQSSSTK
jgi:Carboxylesterase family